MSYTAVFLKISMTHRVPEVEMLIDLHFFWLRASAQGPILIVFDGHKPLIRGQTFGLGQGCFNSKFSIFA